jgi:tryptophan halogenase
MKCFWVPATTAQDMLPKDYHPVVDRMPDHDSNDFMARVRNVVCRCVDATPMHPALIDSCRKA